MAKNKDGGKPPFDGSKYLRGMDSNSPVKMFDDKAFIDFNNKRKSVLKQGRLNTPYQNSVINTKKQNFANNNPNTTFDGNDLVPNNPDRTLTGHALPHTRTQKNDHAMDAAFRGIEAASYIVPGAALGKIGLTAAKKYLTKGATIAGLELVGETAIQGAAADALLGISRKSLSREFAAELASAGKERVASLSLENSFHKTREGLDEKQSKPVVPQHKNGGMIMSNFVPRALNGLITYDNAYKHTEGARQAAAYRAPNSFKPKEGIDAAGISGAIGTAGEFASTLADGDNDYGIEPGQTSVNFGKSTGSYALSGAAKGAAAGLAFGGVGAIVGGAIGLATGLVSGGRERKRENKEAEAISEMNRRKYQTLNMDPNLDPYGNEGAYYMADGGMIDDDPIKKARRVTAVPAGYEPFESKTGLPGAKYYRKLTASSSVINRPVVKRTGVKPRTGVARPMRSATNAADYVYMQPDPVTPVQPAVKPTRAFMGEPLYTGNRLTHLVNYNARSSANEADGGMLNTSKSKAIIYPVFPNTDQPNMNERIEVPGETYSNYFTGGTNRLQGSADSLKTYRVQPQTGISKLEDGGTGDEQELQDNPQEETQEQQLRTVDIERGELLIDPITFDVIREYDNPNLYSPHTKNPQKEPVGNFTQIAPGQVVISKKYASKFKDGDKLTRKSIILEIMKNQRNEPQPMVPAPGSDAPQAKEGLFNPDPYLWGTPGLKPAAATPDFTWTGVDVPETVDDNNTRMFNNTVGRIGAGLNKKNIFSKDNIPASLTESQPYEPQFKDPELPAGGGNRKRFKVTATDAALALNFVPTAFGLAKGMKYEPEQYDENNQIDTAKSLIHGTETNPSIEASRANIDSALAARNKMLGNINSPSVRAEVASNFADVIGAKGTLIQNATNLAMENRNKKRALLAELEVKQGEGRLTAREKLITNMKMNRAASNKMIQSGLSELSQNFGSQVMDQNAINATNNILEFAKINRDGTLKDTKAFPKAVLELINSGKPYTTEDLQKAFIVTGMGAGSRKPGHIVKPGNPRRGRKI